MKPHDEMDAFENPAAELEARIAEASGRGDVVPPEAYAMLARLRELMDAIRGLNATVGDSGDGGGGGEQGGDAPPAVGSRRASTSTPSADDDDAAAAAARTDVDAGRTDR